MNARTGLVLYRLIDLYPHSSLFARSSDDTKQAGGLNNRQQRVIRAAFKASGFRALNPDEKLRISFQKLVKIAEDPSNGLTETEKEVVRAADQNGDGFIDLFEFLAILPTKSSPRWMFSS